ncbi:hypothetical protein BU14_1145s0002 [Porphyra umbilicalis]|uniref:Uncharacterized protein n=1 Tax=Porphyra umbilicalis TaxID=2786 RepID=A0A1X6NN59_PORUM|nr:hypothetical protein BU14_1145s0002 [Porphyra umbilicalis]|eukprot:OSX69793.1 hypothetical protein BU14_1145s0002 [Porphyra umbilicalis]
MTVAFDDDRAADAAAARCPTRRRAERCSCSSAADSRTAPCPRPVQIVVGPLLVLFSCLRSLWGAMSLRHGCFFSTSAVALVPPPGHRRGLAPRLGAPGTPEASTHGAAGRHGQDDLVFLTGQHTTALPVSTAWPWHRPLLHGAASTGPGEVPSSPNHRSPPVFFTPPPVPAVSQPPAGVGGADGLFMWHDAAVAMQLAPQRALDPRTSLSSGPTDGSGGAHGVPVSPSPPLGMPASLNVADDIDVVAPRPPAEQGHSHPRAVAGAYSTHPVGERRRRAPGPPSSPSPPPTRQRRTGSSQAPSPSRPRYAPPVLPQQAPSPAGSVAPGTASSSDSATRRLADMATAHKSGLTSLRGEVTALRKEVVVNTSTLRSLVKKTNDIATVADRLAASIISQRHILLKVPSDVAAAVARFPASGGAAVALSAGGARGTPAGALAVAPVPPRQLSTDETHVEEAYWVLELKGELDKWLLDCFLNAGCTADIWISTADVNAFLRDWVVRRFAVTPSDAIKLLEKRWRLPVRPKRRTRAAPAAAVENRTPAHVLPGTSSKDWTVAYRYLHRGISHLYQRIGAKAVSAFASYVNEELNEGTLRRLRGTKTKYEVFFNRLDAKRLLQDNFILNDNKCRHGLVRALAAVFSSYNVFSRFSEAGQQRDHPRVVVCRLGYFALISTKVRAHLKTRAAAKCRDALDDDGGGNGNHGGRADGDEEHSDGGSGSDAVRDDAVGGNSTIAEPLNGGHRPEWVEELPIVDGVLRPQGAGAFNGLRIVDALDAGRMDSVRPSPPPPSARTRPGTSPARPTVTEPVPQRPIGTAPLLPPTAERVGLRSPPQESDSDGDEAWSSPDDEEDPPRRRRRTREELREAAARRAAARVLTDDVE